jgi:hypothetical protein
MQASNTWSGATRSFVPAICAALAACGSGDGFVGSGSGGAGDMLVPTFDSIQTNVFEPLCAHCHSGANAPAGLRLDAANSYALLVGVASTEQPGVLRVAPGNPNASYVIHKLEGTAAVGERMPAGLPPLPQSDIDVIRQWIADGAQPGSPDTGPIRVTSLDPQPGATLSTLPASIVAGFSRDLNAPSVTTATFTLQRAGADNALGTPDDVAVTSASVTVPAANPRSAVMDLTGVPPVNDRYRVTLVGTGAATILDLAGNALDGEPVGLPSGDGVAGGSYTADFTVGTQPTLASIQTDVFAPRCSGCHNGAGPGLPGAMNLTTAAASHAALVGVASIEQPGLQRVAPGDPDSSYLIRKLEGGPNIAGARMPLLGPTLDQPAIDAIRLWIANGAAQ